MTRMPEIMQALFVHGMGRSPLSGWPMLWKLRRGGWSPSTFGYSAAWENFAAIQGRLTARISTLAARGNYVLIGHSLGGVLLRAAMASLPPATRRPEHLFLLASPIQAPRLAKKLSTHRVYRLITGDCGQLLASDGRMAGIGAPHVPATAIAGVRGLPWTPDPFAGEPSDGVVSLSEVSADWLADPIRIHTLHTFLPSSAQVGGIILKVVQKAL